METKLLYYEDQYLKKISARILEVVDQGVILDKTIFYGKSCGVKPDIGTISCNGLVSNVNGISVDHERRIIHQIDDVHLTNLEVDQEVILAVDWERRYSQMKMHTLLHILSAIVWKQFDTYVTGSDITPDKGKLDFDFDRNLTVEELKQIEERSNQIIQEDHITSVDILPIEIALSIPGVIRTKTNILPKHLTEVRVMRIGTKENQIDYQTDGGIHVRSTKEIGQMKIIKHRNKGKGRRRIEVAII